MGNFEIKDGVLVKYNGNESHVVILDCVTKIGMYAFYECSGLKHIEIPNSVTSIGACAFYNCKKLTSVKIPNSVTWIGDLVLAGCENLTNIEIPNSVTSIGEGAFEDCVNLTRVKIPNSVTTISYKAFNGCIKLASIEIPKSVIKIGLSAFRHVPQVEPQHNAEGKLRAFKAFKSDWKCRGFQYEVGKTFHQDGEINCGKSGFHACLSPLDVYNYYYGAVNKLHFAEVELSGKIDWKEDKVASSDIKIVRELTASCLAKIYNSMENVI